MHSLSRRGVHELPTWRNGRYKRPSEPVQSYTCLPRSKKCILIFLKKWIGKVFKILALYGIFFFCIRVCLIWVTYQNLGWAAVVVRHGTQGWKSPFTLAAGCWDPPQPGVGDDGIAHQNSEYFSQSEPGGQGLGGRPEWTSVHSGPVLEDKSRQCLCRFV